VVLRVFALVVAALALAAPAAAITGGTLDGDAHPAVGLMLADHGSGPVPECSGTLVSPTVFLTAAHCVADLPSRRVWVTFDSQVSSTTSQLRPGTAYAHPEFSFTAPDTPHIGVVVLDQPVAGIVPAQLPRLNALAGGATTLVAVGYGYNARITGGGKPRWAYDGARRFVAVPVTSVGPTSVTTAIKNGGTCFGDSGGPHLLGTTVVAVTSTGDKKCRKEAVAYRVDTPSARAFLAQFVALP